MNKELFDRLLTVKSRDLSMEITKDSDIQEIFNKLMSEFLSELPSRIESLPATIFISVETGINWWNFIATIDSTKYKKTEKPDIFFFSLAFICGIAVGTLLWFLK